MKLILVRHGETQENVDNILIGQDDGKLTQKGIDESKKVGKELKEKYNVDLVFCSPLGRCIDTLNNILDEYPIEGEVLMSKLIMERDFGEYTGVESILVNMEELDEDNKINREMGVESLINMVKRVNLFLEDLKMENANSTILVVSHGGPIKIIIAKLTGKTFDEIEVPNTSTFVFDLKDEE